MDKKYKVGYTAGVFDLFHYGHLNLIKRAKERCDYLIVAVSTDELVKEYKNTVPVIPYEERKAIVESIRYVDQVVPQINRDKIAAYENYHFDVMFVGDDWQGSEVFEKVDSYMRARGGCVEYLPYTQNVSSTTLRGVLNKIYSGEEENVRL
ncbi:adenylyltransferase/cytidyltransferase family protein [Cohnella caldifontis]|uniref:adenylyltransferase/cytidyltransferase family protein n=1 Tax=Cohnella caldifontis TaxID=3027471 RepID=UPI0023EB5CE3|nr:adenylyltransferase/cytidyltransferase family protein [Cohnella sp. YIM B05605]